MSDSRYDEIEDILTAYEDDWQQGRAPSIETVLASLTRSEVTLLPDLVKLELEYRLRANPTVQIEEYLTRFPDLATSNEQLLDLVAHEYFLRQHLGLAVKQTDFQTRFPQFGQELIVRLESLRVGLPEVPDYELREVVGHGGMGVIYRAMDLELQRSVAVKLVRGTHAKYQEARQRFIEEARITGRLQHPGIPPVHRLGQRADGQPFLVMKLIEGRTLAAHLAERPTSDDAPRFLHIVEQICQTVAYAHRHQIVHRDLKPANIMLGAFGEVQVMDWGLAKVLGSTPDDPMLPSSPAGTTQAGTILGTPAYMAPEQAHARHELVNTQADVFSLGAILCEILTGQPPYTSANAVVEAQEAKLESVYQRLAQCGADHEIVALAQSCLATEIDQRPANAIVLAEAITRHRLRTEERLAAVEREQAVAQAKIAAEARRRRLVTVSASLVVGLLVAGIVGTSFGFYRAGRQLERAVNAEQDNRVRLAASFVDNARLHAQQGQWRAALTAFDHARAHDYPDTAELVFERWNALRILNENTRLEQEVAQWSARSERTTDEDARVALWRSELLLAEHANHDRVLAEIDVALTAKLPADELAYARGLRASTSVEAVQHFRKAVAENPLHHRAQQHLVMLLLLLGRKDELRTELQVARERFGEDTRWSAFRAILAALDGDRDSCEQEVTAWNQAWPDIHHQRLLRTTVDLCYHSKSVERLVSLDHPEQPQVAAAIVPRVAAWISAIGQHLAANGAPFPLTFPPVLRLGYGHLAKHLPFDVVNDSIAFTKLSPAEQTSHVEKRLSVLGLTLNIEALSAIVAAHPEGNLRYALGTLLASKRRRTEAERELFQVDDRSSIFPIQRMAHLVALEMAFEQWANTKRGDVAEARRIRDLTKRYKPQFQLGENSAFTQVHLEGLASKAWQSGEPILARDLIAMWLEAVPNDPRAYRMLAAVHYTNQEYMPAYLNASHALRLKPSDPQIRNDLQTILRFSPNFQRTLTRMLDIIESRAMLDIAVWFMVQPRPYTP